MTAFRPLLELTSISLFIAALFVWVAILTGAA